ncbi:hypothetical protein [Rhodopseudomonas telluris]|uniref:Uncharacterized protein n=1 Tax=Rhodopseudomonas telluris TaxID=644215 RepID=A0ABV6EZH6_9BRAD
MQDVEDTFVSACRRMGYAPTASAMRRAGVVLAGATLTNGMFTLPNLGAISPADLARSLRAEAPEDFADLSQASLPPHGRNLTERMAAEVAASRKPRALPSDWEAVRRTKAGLTAEFMSEIEDNRKK